MECRFSFKHMDSSDALVAYTEEKVVGKIERFATKPIEAHITFSIDGLDHRVHLNVAGGDGFSFQVDASSPDMYASADLMLDKLGVRLKKQKEKIKTHKHGQNIKNLEVLEVLDKEECDNVPVDADDLLKFEQAKKP